MRMLDRQTERYMRGSLRGSFEALVLVGSVARSGEARVRLARVFVAPQGRRWEYLDTGEIYLAQEAAGVVAVWRLNPKSRVASLVEESKEAAPPRRAKRSARVETYRSLRCAVEESEERSAELVAKTREWRVLDQKAQNWVLRAELQAYTSQQLAYVSLWDTLEIQFKNLPSDLFTVPSDYRVTP